MQNQGAASILGLMSLGMVIISDGINKAVQIIWEGQNAQGLSKKP